MPRKPRDVSAGIHHAWVNATAHWPLFVDDVDRLMWIRRLVLILERYDWRCVAFCQMTTHVHLVLIVNDGDLPLGMRDLNREHAKDFNERHRRAGAFLRKRYGSRRIEGAKDLLETYAYVVNNPEKEELSESERWRWSSYRTTLGLCDDFPFVDASVVLAELGGSVDALQRLVASRAGRRIA